MRAAPTAQRDNQVLAVKFLKNRANIFPSKREANRNPEIGLTAERNGGFVAILSFAASPATADSLIRRFRFSANSLTSCCDTSAIKPEALPFCATAPES